MSQVNCCGSYPSSDAQPADKLTHELDLDENAEGRDEDKRMAMTKLLPRN